MTDDFFSLEAEAHQTPLFGGSRVDEPAEMRVGDADLALKALHDEYSQKLFSYSLSMLRSREDAEDAVQTTFMNAYGSLTAGRAPRQEASWLFRIARNVCLNRIRTQQRKPASTIEGIDVASSRSVEDVMEQRLHSVALRHALERLPEQQRKAIVMRELQGASYTEIATALETTQGAVESLIFRARRQLAGSLQNFSAERIAGSAAA
jgi:RNA polymerase sigma factor (sigma-70 family)